MNCLVENGSGLRLLARAVFPPILLADEPTVNLDSKTGADILALIRDLHTKYGATVVVVTHDPKAAETCERTLTIRDGHVVDDRRLVNA
jgi:lipoprotein-releasing system ATP-binding protein